MRPGLLAIVLAACAAAQDYRELDDFLNRARGLPPEFAADLLLNVAESSPALLVKRRTLLVEEAFHLAASAQMPAPLAGGGFHTETRPGMLEFASETGLNSLALQARAIRSMASLDTTRLRVMFAEMRPLPLQPGSCQNIMRPQLGEWARTITLVMEQGFSVQEKEKGLHEQWLLDQVRAISSPLQMAVVFPLIEAAPPGRREALESAVASALRSVNGDWFAFEYTAKSTPLTPVTAEPARDYIVRHLRGPRCGPRWPFPKPAAFPPGVERFHQFLKERPDLPVQPIDVERLEPSRIDESAKLIEWWQSGKSKQVLAELKWLNHGNRPLARSWTPEERQSVEWNERYLGFLKLLDQWQASDEESAVDYVHMRAQTYHTLFALLPPGNQRQNALRNFISFMNGAFQSDGILHAEWFVATRRMLTSSGADPAHLQELELHGNPVLSTYAHLRRRGANFSPREQPKAAAGVR